MVEITLLFWGEKNSTYFLVFRGPPCPPRIPIASMGLVYLPTFKVDCLFVFMVNVGKYTIHGCYGILRLLEDLSTNPQKLTVKLHHTHPYPIPSMGRGRTYLPSPFCHKNQRYSYIHGSVNMSQWSHGWVMG